MYTAEAEQRRKEEIFEEKCEERTQNETGNCASFSQNLCWLKISFSF